MIDAKNEEIEKQQELIRQSSRQEKQILEISVPSVPPVQAAAAEKELAEAVTDTDDTEYDQ